MRFTAKWDTPSSHRGCLSLLAMYRDGGEQSPLAKHLAARLNLTVPELDRVLGQLAAGGLIWTVRRPGQRNRYWLLCLGDQVPAEDRQRYETFKAHQRARRDRRR